MSEAVQITLIFCTTMVAIVGIVAMVVYNRDNIAVKVQTKANIIDKAKTDFSVEIKDKKKLDYARKHNLKMRFIFK
ncbi:hypothetical protein [Thermoanaerobacterium thermosaccharolyticum]|uniref:Uncharacterized protein n=1 Tax=Thermoanaerobacterium thermosaccharolyticum M0795 TaxID=698948 RepID=L0IMI4_THETR|nr:hypothetical protein [Thermoanaerobacterium thermosaccharolyticum]AGB20078.1 hypothetical protein Thethe_02512 [Thermoanaerobacterium thermosaccharolyticum M0795]